MRASLPSLMHELVWMLPEQLAAALELEQTVQLKRSHSVGNVVVLGMGGSAIVGDLVRCLLQKESKTPVFVCRDYHIPRFVTKESLVIVVSYGGGTEETISAYQEATPCRPAFVVVTSGGKLAEMAAANRHQVVALPKGLPPRAAIGYLTVAVLMSLARFRVCRSYEPDLKETVDLLQRRRRQWLRKATSIARVLDERLPIVYSTSRFLDVVADRWRCQLNENSKVLCHTNYLPEQNHNEIVGIGSPKFLARRCTIVALLDKETDPRNRLRLRHMLALTQSGYDRAVMVSSEGQSRLARLFSLVMIGDLVSCELARLRGVDPMPIERIVQLRQLMARER